MGSSMCSTLFCRPSTKVVETYPGSSVNVFTWAFGQFIPLEFAYLIGTSIVDTSRNCHDWDYNLNLNELRQLLVKTGIV